MSERRFEKVALTALVIDAAYQALPNWDEEQLILTASELRAEGDVRVPVVIDEANRVLDGHQRVTAAKMAKLSGITCERVVGLEDIDKLRHVFGQLNRRHLTRDELRQAAKDAILRMHRYSDSRIALTIGIVTDKTVGVIRKELITEGNIPDHETLIGVGGTTQKAKKAKKGGTKKPDDKDAGEDNRPQKEETTQAQESKDANQKQEEDKEPEEGGGAGEAEDDQDRNEPEQAEAPKPEEESHDAEVTKDKEDQQPKTEQPKPLPKKGRKEANAKISNRLAAKAEEGSLVLKGQDLNRLPPDLNEANILIVIDPDATHVTLTLDVARPTLVIFHPQKR